MNHEEWQGLETLIPAEVYSIMEQYTALTPMPTEHREKIRKERPDHIFDSRCHLRRKPVGTNGVGCGLSRGPIGSWPASTAHAACG